MTCTGLSLVTKVLSTTVNTRINCHFKYRQRWYSNCCLIVIIIVCKKTKKDYTMVRRRVTDKDLFGGSWECSDVLWGVSSELIVLSPNTKQTTRSPPRHCFLHHPGDTLSFIHYQWRHCLFSVDPGNIWCVFCFCEHQCVVHGDGSLASDFPRPDFKWPHCFLCFRAQPQLPSNNSHQSTYPSNASCQSSVHSRKH